MLKWWMGKLLQQIRGLRRQGKRGSQQDCQLNGKSETHTLH
jgi:hypothetical protein